MALPGLAGMLAQRKAFVDSTAEVTSAAGRSSAAHQAKLAEDLRAGGGARAARAAAAGTAGGADSFLPRSPTGRTGLSNQGSTCYLNSLLQALYALPDFRRAVYAWRYDSATHGADESGCLPRQLQRLFAFLQLSVRRAVPTAGLTTAFGWRGAEAFQQQDVQASN